MAPSDEDNIPGGEEEEEEDERPREESDSEEEDDRPKKRRRNRKFNQFLDMEAEVDEDGDEDEEDGEEGFDPNDGFIVPSRPRESAALPAFGEQDQDQEPDNFASHRRLDRRINAQQDREAAELAASFHDRYKRNRYDADTMDESAPKALLLPGVNDPSIWGVRCKPGRERDLVLSISRKAVAMASADNSSPLQIISAFNRDSLKGYLYVEARAEDQVRQAVQGLMGVYLNGPNSLFLVDIEEMPDLLKTRQKKVELKPGSWARIRRGKHSGDLCQVIDPTENGDEVVVKFIPRIDLAPREEGVMIGSDGKKRKKGSSAPIAFRPPQRLFNAEEVAKVYGSKEVIKKPGGVYIFRNEEYANGYCEKSIRISGLILDDVTPTIDELTLFLGSKAIESGVENGDLEAIANAAKKSATSSLQPGDQIEILQGDQKGIYGTILSISGETMMVEPAQELHLEIPSMEVPTHAVRKRFKPGDHVKVLSGSNMDETGLVVHVDDEIVTFLSDSTHDNVTVFAKDLVQAAEVGSGINVVGQFEAHDLVQIDNRTCGVIFRIERDIFRILDQNGTVRLIKPNEVGIKIDTRNAVATDADGYDIRQGDKMEESQRKIAGEARKGTVLHLYRSLFAFLFNREITENGGVFVTHARSLSSSASAARRQMIKPGSGINPDLYGKQQQMVAAQGATVRRDLRLNRHVYVSRGDNKGNTGIIKDINGPNARVELHSKNKTISIKLEFLKEQKADGTLIPLVERQSDRQFNGQDTGNMRNGPSYGARSGGFGGGRTPAAGFQAGGRTPAPGFNAGGRTPAPGFNAGGRTPAAGFNAGGRTPNVSNWSVGSKTPAYGSGDAWNPSSRTPHHSSSSGDPWEASSKTPYHNSTSGYSKSNVPDTPASTNAWDDWDSAPTPAMSAPTPAPQRHDYGAPQAKTPFADVSTPWGDSAPTPGYGYAPTPGAGLYGAPTPYGGAPTPDGYASTPGMFGGAAATPGAALYAGAATAAAHPVEYKEKARETRLPNDWTIVGARVVFGSTGFLGGRHAGKQGFVFESGGNGLCGVMLDEEYERVLNVPSMSIEPIQPTKPDQEVMVLAGEFKNQTAKTLSKDGNEWMVSVNNTQAILESKILALKH